MSKFNITDAYINALQEALNNKLPTTEKIAKFLEESINWLEENQEGCCQYKLDSDLSLFVGWSDGYAEDDETVIHAKEDLSFAIVAGIKSNHDYLKTDYDWLNYPYDEKTGEVWDTGMSLSRDEDFIETAKWYLEQYEAIREALNDGALVLESKKQEARSHKEDNEKAVPDRAIRTAFVGDGGKNYYEEPIDNDLGLNTKRNKVRSPEQAERNYARKEQEYDKNPDSERIGNNDFTQATWEESPNTTIRYYQANKRDAQRARERGDNSWAEEYERTAQMHADNIRAKHTKKTENLSKSNIYDEISATLTDYEEGFAGETELYNMLVKVQNRWEDTITACNESNNYDDLPEEYPDDIKEKYYEYVADLDLIEDEPLDFRTWVDREYPELKVEKLTESVETYDDILAKIQDADESNIYKGLAEFVMWYMDSHRDELIIDTTYETVDLIAWELTDSEETDKILGDLTQKALEKYEYVKAETNADNETGKEYVCGEEVTGEQADIVNLVIDELASSLAENDMQVETFDEPNYGTWINVKYGELFDTFSLAIYDEHATSLDLLLFSGGEIYEDIDTSKYTSKESLRERNVINFNLIRVLDKEGSYRAPIDESNRIVVKLSDMSMHDTKDVATVAKTIADDFKTALNFVNNLAD